MTFSDTARAVEAGESLPPPARRLGPAEAVPCGEGRLFDLEGWRVAVFRLRDGAVHAVQPDCPHRGGPLADGLTGGQRVVCPLHGWTFDLLTGRRAGGEEVLRTYPARVEDGQIVVSDPAAPHA